MEEQMSRRERKKLQSRKVILDAAVREFSSKGFRDTSVADIMGAADLGIGTFYNYFNSKEEVLMSLLGRLSEDVVAALDELKAARRPAVELLLAGSRITAKFLDENRYVLPLFLSASEDSSLPEGMAGRIRLTPRFKPVFTNIIRQGQEAGELRGDVPAELVAEMFHSVYQAASFSRLNLSFQENVALKTRILLDGIRQSGERQS